MKRELIARVAHDINRAYCASLGDDSQPSWEEAPDWQQASALAGVDMHLANPDATPEQSHESWLKQKADEGWTYGETKDAEKKQHPCFLPYDELPAEQKSKDYLFRAVVHALKDIPDAEEAVAKVLASIPVNNGAAVGKSGLHAVQYTGNKPVWRDRVYHSGLTFTPGQVRNLPEAMAVKLLRHVDIFARAPALVAAAEDDTQHQLEQGAAREKSKDKTQLNFDVIDQVRAMNDRDSLVDFAMTRFQLKLSKTMKAETMQGKIIDHINQFGVA